jgi:hypothetical protein
MQAAAPERPRSEPTNGRIWPLLASAAVPLDCSAADHASPSGLPEPLSRSYAAHFAPSDHPIYPHSPLLPPPRHFSAPPSRKEHPIILTQPFTGLYGPHAAAGARQGCCRGSGGRIGSKRGVFTAQEELHRAQQSTAWALEALLDRSRKLSRWG